MTVAVKDKNIIEPLDPKKHDRAAFSCGVDQVDNYFKLTANKLAKAGNVRVFVMTTPDGDTIGFYALNAHSIDYIDLPESFARNRPKHGSIPAAYISMIGVDKRYAGNRYGDDLLVDCLRRILLVSENLGMAVVVLDVLDCGNPNLVEKRLRLYKSHGFKPISSSPLRLVLPIATVKALSA